MSDIFKKILLILLILIVFSSGLILFAESKSNPKYIFYFIGDGLGLAQRELAEIYLEEKNQKQLLMNNLPITGNIRTSSLDSLITDSAAAGTALATGYKTKNGMISVLSEKKNVKTIVEYAEGKRWATGIITSTRLTHATPAVFASHNPDRGNENEIAADLVKSGVDYFSGGGLRHFIPYNMKNSKREDNKNLIKVFENNGYRVLENKKEFLNFQTINFEKYEKIFACYSLSHLPYVINRKDSKKIPTLSESTDKAISLLKKNKNGFFLMVEGGRIDHAAHMNDPATMIHEILEFDSSIRTAYKFYKKHSDETLIVVLADHETGGLGLGYGNNYSLDIKSLHKQEKSIGFLLEQKIYDGSRKSFINYIEGSRGFNNLTREEKKKIYNQMDEIDRYIKKEDKEYSLRTNYSFIPALSDIISERALIQWTSSAHTAIPVPVTAVGVKSEKFSGVKKNTEAAEIIINIIEKSEN
ncbi:MAG: alkaline phosphatase [Candidatus Mcinerneyibacterium aminivorans]|uniref:Alkaline phosphatase n=1 Tax=Candidatus Mcinerneyibacterium aminivorans TaxID=2703815 RepID=A0A5D0MCU5_9BACT|nr:MAG: alkaline phosphatase [Candidatus Mcinerneyibacterium aminivorans]